MNETKNGERIRLLVYYNNNKYSNILITYMKALQERGIEVYALINAEEGPLQEELRKEGIKVFSYTISKRERFSYYFLNMIVLHKAIRKLGIDVVHSHTHEPNLISSIVSLFSRTAHIIIRHHYRPFGFHFSFNEKVVDYLIHILAPIIVVLSKTVKRGICQYEHFACSKLVVIPNVYDFSRYPKPDPEKVEEIRQRYRARLLLLAVSRLTPLKRPFTLLRVAKRLIDEGFDIKLLVLGEGELKGNLDNWIKKHGLDDKIFLLGFREDIVNYMASADVLISASMTDASNSSVKEMALQEKIVIVPSYVGDFSEYIKHGENGFLVPMENTEDHIVELLKGVYHNLDKYKPMGKKLKEVVLKRFDIRYAKWIIDKHVKLIRNALKYPK